jgi:hypothetical protein
MGTLEVVIYGSVYGAMMANALEMESICWPEAPLTEDAQESRDSYFDLRTIQARQRAEKAVELHRQDETKRSK